MSEVTESWNKNGKLYSLNKNYNVMLSNFLNNFNLVTQLNLNVACMHKLRQFIYILAKRMQKHFYLG